MLPCAWRRIVHAVSGSVIARAATRASAARAAIRRLAPNLLQEPIESRRVATAGQGPESNMKIENLSLICVPFILERPIFALPRHDTYADACGWAGDEESVEGVLDFDRAGATA